MDFSTPEKIIESLQNVANRIVNGTLDRDSADGVAKLADAATRAHVAQVEIVEKLRNQK